MQVALRGVRTSLCGFRQGNSFTHGEGRKLFPMLVLGAGFV
jgi:hypothetical protein